MKIKWQEVAERLRREIAEYGQLLNLFEEQHQLILRNAPHRVLQSSHTIEAQIEVLGRERGLREETIAAFATGLGQSPSATLRSLLPFIEEMARPLFKALITDVNLLAHRVRRDSRRNQRLLQCVVECHREILRRLRPDAFTKTYAADGRISLAAVRSVPSIQTAG